MMRADHFLVAALCLTGISASAQQNDEEYTKLIKQYLQDPRITTELVVRQVYCAE